MFSLRHIIIYYIIRRSATTRLRRPIVYNVRKGYWNNGVAYAILLLLYAYGVSTLCRKEIHTRAVKFTRDGGLGSVREQARARAKVHEFTWSYRAPPVCKVAFLRKSWTCRFWSAVPTTTTTTTTMIVQVMTSAITINNKIKIMLWLLCTWPSIHGVL